MYYFDIYKDEHNFNLVYFVFDYSKSHSEAHGHVGNKKIRAWINEQHTKESGESSINLFSRLFSQVSSY